MGWEFWGLKTVALFDAWSFEHLVAGMSVGGFAQYVNRKENSLRLDLVTCLFLAYCWEAVEHYLEAGLAGGAVLYWFQGVEFWANRLITDPLLTVGGMMIVRARPRLVWPARAVSAAWLIVHIFVFPHSMYLHEVL